MVKISIDKNTGEIKIEGEGIIGAGCIKELDKISNILNATTIERKKKSEFYYSYQKIKNEARR